MVNSSDVDAAVVQRLVTDPTLAALMPDGVWLNVARKDATRFVVLELLTHTDTYGFNFEAWELFGYQVKAVSLNSTGSDVNAAAARIRELLTDAVDMPIPGYPGDAVETDDRHSLSRCRRREPVDPLATPRRALRRASHHVHQYRARGSRARRDQIRGDSNAWTHVRITRVGRTDAHGRDHWRHAGWLAQ